MEKIFLYNHFHNGDVFYSRILIEEIKNNFQIYYYHNLTPPLFEDMPEIIEISGIPPEFQIHHSNFEEKQINTWIGQENSQYIKVNNGCTYENYRYLVDEILKKLNLESKYGNQTLPKIYYNNLINHEELSSQILNYKKQYDKIILISNGAVNSGQSPPFDFTQIASNLANENKNYLFLLTHNFPSSLPNLVFTYDLTKKSPDLLQIGFISTFCDVIVGRASGPYCFSQNETNLLNSEKKFICISNIYDEGKYYNKMLSKFIWSQTNNQQEIMNLIKNNIS
jgi:hypothetical protein